MSHPRNAFSSQLRIEFIHKYNLLEAWQQLSDANVKELKTEIAPLIPPIEDPELAKRFDLLLYTMELATLKGETRGSAKKKVIQTARLLAEKGNLPQVQRHAALIQHLQTDDYWNHANLNTHEEVRIALRGLLLLLDPQNTEIYYTDFHDEAVDVVETPGEYGAVSQLLPYRARVHAYLKEHQNDLVIHKLRNNKELTKNNVQHLEKLLWKDLGSEDEYHQTFGEEALVTLVARLVGLERDAANQLFSEFLHDQSLSSQQMEFVTLIVDHVVENGALDKNVLQDHPFNRYGSVTRLFEGKKDTVQKILQRIDALNLRQQMG